jgi:predicted GNAT family acetyltransferase
MVPPTSHLLDNPIWHALSTCQERFAEVSHLARRFPVEVTSLAGVAEPTPESFAALASLTRRGEEAALFLTSLPEPPAGWTVVEQVPLPQMVHHGGRPKDSDFEADLLTFADVPHMMALAELTKPGPFANRTCEMGNYLGVRREGRLAAMAGERLHLPGYTEVSAVCTHPEYLSQGLAANLIAAVVRQIYDRDEVPFLHVRPDNRRAIALYERLGFRERTRLLLLVLRKDG